MITTQSDPNVQSIYCIIFGPSAVCAPHNQNLSDLYTRSKFIKGKEDNPKELSEEVVEQVLYLGLNTTLRGQLKLMIVYENIYELSPWPGKARKVFKSRSFFLIRGGAGSLT